MKKHKNDIILLIILILTFLILSLFTVKNNYLLGSNTNWYQNNISIPEYFRTLFYSNKSIFPDLALHLGNGQNIYNFAFYGLLSPITLLSFLFANVSMMTYQITINLFLVLASTILLYYFLRKHNFNEHISFISSLCFVLSTPIVIHSHNNYLLINYLPFLIMGLFGVDKKEQENKSWLLILSVFLMIMTSLQASISGIICILLYALYLYLKKTKKVTFKSLSKTMFHTIGPILTAIFMSSILLIPAFTALINNHQELKTVLNIKELLLPTNINNLLYDSYGLGLSILIIPALINLFSKDKANLTLTISLILIASINIFNYLFNGTMFISSRSLIPFLPLYIYTIAIFFNDLFNQKIDYRKIVLILFVISIFIFHTSIKIHYTIELILFLLILIIYKKIPKKEIVIIPIFFILAGSAYLTNLNDNYELRLENEENETIIEDDLNIIKNQEEDFYRVNIDLDNKYLNKTFNHPNYHSSSFKSVLKNNEYIFNKNIFELLLLDNKYLITYDKPVPGYELLSTNNGLNIYKNNNTFSLGFSTPNVMSYEDYEKLNYFTSKEALLNVIVTDNHSHNEFVSNISETKITLADFQLEENISLKENKQYKYPIPKEYKNKILLISFKTDNKQDIIINHRHSITNNEYNYILDSDNQEYIYLTIPKGIYKISDFHIYYIDFNYLEQATKNIDRFIIDTIKTKKDRLAGTINVTNDGYFIMTLPYSEGYSIKVDGKKTPYERVDNYFIGFPIEEGNHEIDIIYRAPGKILSIIITIIGFISYITIIIVEEKRKI